MAYPRIYPSKYPTVYPSIYPRIYPREGHESGWGGGKGFFQNTWFLNHFRHNKSEPDLTVDLFFTLFLNSLPNRFRLEMEPHELIWKSVTANLHRLFQSILKICFGILDIWNLVSRLFIFQTLVLSNKCVSGPGDVWACPRICRSIQKTENVGQTTSVPRQKLIVYTLPSIW